MSKEFMKRYTLQRDPSEIKSVYSDEKIGCEMNFTMQMAFESMRESFAKQTDEAIINFLIKKYRDTNVSDIFVFSETDFKQFIIDMVPKWRNEKENTKYKSLEEEIGCPLEVAFKALKNGIYVEEGTFEKYDVRGIELRGLSVISKICSYAECDFTCYYTDYKKTWWLKEDKSE